VREPWAALALVHAELLEATLDTLCELRRAPAGIRQDEHADRAGLAIPHELELERLDRLCFAAQEIGDRLHQGTRLRSEERERDVEGLENSTAAEGAPSPPDDLGADVVGHLEGEEEPDPVIAADGSAPGHVGE
jgi:hypothetical protein